MLNNRNNMNDMNNINIMLHNMKNMNNMNNMNFMLHHRNNVTLCTTGAYYDHYDDYYHVVSRFSHVFVYAFGAVW